SYKAATDRLARLQELMAQIDGAQDQKAAQDLANRIGVEQTLLQNENARVAMMVQMQQMQMKVAEEQRESDFMNKYFSSPEQ
ncbi:MAG: type IV secretion system protein, partial [Betaproteobacteria bacterium]|nr:type IV secretion system protein [Betaproteobacteria bacterium]